MPMEPRRARSVHRSTIEGMEDHAKLKKLRKMASRELVGQVIGERAAYTPLPEDDHFRFPRLLLGFDVEESRQRPFKLNKEGEEVTTALWSWKETGGLDGQPVAEVVWEALMEVVEKTFEKIRRKKLSFQDRVRVVMLDG